MAGAFLLSVLYLGVQKIAFGVNEIEAGDGPAPDRHILHLFLDNGPEPVCADHHSKTKKKKTPLEVS